MSDGTDIIDALANLGSSRLPYKLAAARQRDQCVREGKHRWAALYQSLAVAIAEIEDRERALLRELEADESDTP